MILSDAAQGIWENDSASLCVIPLTRFYECLIAFQAFY